MLSHEQQHQSQNSLIYSKITSKAAEACRLTASVRFSYSSVHAKSGACCKMHKLPRLSLSMKMHLFGYKAMRPIAHHKMWQVRISRYAACASRDALFAHRGKLQVHAACARSPACSFLLSWAQNPNCCPAGQQAGRQCPAPRLPGAKISLSYLEAMASST